MFNVYRKVGDDWVGVNDRPIVVNVPASTDWRNIVEVDVSELLEPQPKGEYIVGLVKLGDGSFRLWAKEPPFEDGRQRIVGSDRWKKTDAVPGIQLQIEY